jgi:PAS domain S-box-containing protein
MIRHGSETRWWRSPAACYATAVIASSVGLLLAHLAREYLGPHYLFILLTAVVFSAWYGGGGPGLLATGLSGLMAGWLFLIEPGVQGLALTGAFLQLGLFLLAGVLTSVLYESERNSRRRAERLSAERNAILRQLADGVILTDTEGRVLFANDAAGALQPGAVPGATVQAMLRSGKLRDVSGEPLVEERFPLREAHRRDTPIRDAVWRVQLEDGRERIIEGSAAPVHLAGEPYGAVLVLRDVTDPRSLAAERDRLLMEREGVATRAAFFADASTVLASSLDLEVTLSSIARLSVTQLADWCLVDLREPDGSVRRMTVTHRDPADEPIATVLLANPPAEPPEDVALRVMRDGKPALLARVDADRLAGWARNDEHLSALRGMGIRSLLCVPLATHGRVLGAITMALSGSARKFGPEDVELVMELANRSAIAVEHAQLYAAALAGNKAKTDFLAVMSHELRTPLNAIIGYADLMRTGVPEPLPPALQPYVERTLAASRHLLQLIDEVLNFSRIEAGRSSIQLENSEISILLREVRMLLEPLASEKQLAFTVRWPEEPVVMRTDSRKVRQILVNLTANAIKFTETGSVSISSWQEEDDVYFAVSDTGIGIEADHLEKVFEPFWQVEQRNTRRTGGTGLGLSIVRRLAQLLGGNVHIQSAPGEGSTFTVRLPQRLERRRRRDDVADEEDSLMLAEESERGAEA